MTTWADEAAATDPGSAPDPYQTLGIAPEVSDAELRRAYHRLALLHHPDHNGSSQHASGRFAEIQRAYNTVLGMRSGIAAPDPRSRRSPRHTWAEPWLDERIAAIERGYEAQRWAAEYGSSARPPVRPGEPDSLRERLTDLFRRP